MRVPFHTQPARWLAACAIALWHSTAVWAASPAVDLAARLGDSDPLSALAILRQAHESGDLEASTVLASFLFFAPEPHGNKQRACTLARELTEKSQHRAQGQGWAVLASCYLAGTVPATDRLEAARASARRAVALGAPGGGTALFTAYVVDARKTPPGDASRIALQSEAWSGLSFALESRDPMAAGFAIPALYEAAAPGNAARILAAAERSSDAAKRHPDAVAAARRFAELGGTHAPLVNAANLMRAGRQAAALGMVRDHGLPCAEIDIDRIEPGAEPADATYLPVALGPLVKSLLLQGQWEERWVFTGCDREVAVRMAFKADGRGGASYEASALPRSVVLKPLK